MPRLLSSAIVGCLAVLATARADGPAGVEHFERHVRPVLVEKCVSCHGPTAQKGGLRLDTRANVLKGGEGGIVVVPGKPQDSRLTAALRHDGDLQMPPGKKLPAAEVEALAGWVAQGLPWPENVSLSPPNTIDKAAKAHWAFRPVQQPPVPPGTAANPIDRFVHARLEAAKLTPSPRADKRTLLRRVAFDLIGLPPTPEEFAAFEADTAPDAYVKAVDRLLASPHHGERWARHWLDVARYADNKGYVLFEDKPYPWAWTYRDYVVAALNEDKPFDRFVLEQLAADQLDGAPLAALGFVTVGGHFMNNIHNVIDDRIDVVTRGLMGLTVSCARCHDHKFDPIPTADYYALYGVFRGCYEPVVPPLAGPAPGSLVHAAYASELAAREQRLNDLIADRHAEMVRGGRERAAEYLLAAHATRGQPPDDEFMLLADRTDLHPAMITRWRNFLERTRAEADPTWALWHRYADLKPDEFAANATGVPKSLAGVNGRVRAAFAVPPRSLKEVAGRYGKLLAEASASPATDPAAVGLRAALYGDLSAADAPLALDWGVLSIFPDRPSQDEYKKRLKAVDDWIGRGPPRAMALLDAPRPFDPRVFLRGQPSRPGDAVPRQFLKVANPGRQPFASGSGRLELAKEIASPTNPLTARVIVNRVWMHHLGRGLVSTPGDFGLRSDPPTHPDLLDWLAADFVQHGWSLKRLHKQIVTSDTYTQASPDRPEGKADPENRLLWRANRKRLEFEALADSLLAVSDGLNRTVGGKPVPPLAGGRRAVYWSIDRLDFPPTLATFDVPSPAATTPQRVPTTVAPQALYLMNGPAARDAAKRLVASKRVQAAKTPEGKVEALFLAALGRKPDADERAAAARFADRWADLAHGLLMTNEFAFVD